ncbi:MAG: Tfx family DNA-binding protein [Thermoprotei archaeon]
MNRQRVASINIRRRYLEKRRRGKKPRMRGFPHSYEPESSMRVELWVGVTLSGRSPVIWIPMKGDPEGDDVKGEGLISNYIKPNENRTPKFGLFTVQQLEVLKLRSQGFTQKEIAEKLGTTRENVSIIERRVKRNIERIKESLEILKGLGILVEVNIKPGTHIIEIPKIVYREADRFKVKIKGSFIQMYEDVRFRAKNKIKDTQVIKEIRILVLPNGDYIIE